MFSYEINVFSTLFVLPLWLINRDYQESTLMQRCHVVWIHPPSTYLIADPLTNYNYAIGCIAYYAHADR
jgi:hypothetical protein